MTLLSRVVNSILFPIDDQLQGLCVASIRQCMSTGDDPVIVYVVGPSSASSSPSVANCHYYLEVLYP